MPEKPISRITIEDWEGLVSNRGPFSGKPGAAKVLINLRSVQPGVLETRGGMRRLYFGEPPGYNPPEPSSSEASSEESSSDSSDSTSSDSSESASSSDTRCTPYYCSVELEGIDYVDGYADPNGLYIADAGSGDCGSVCQWSESFNVGGDIYSLFVYYYPSSATLYVTLQLSSNTGLGYAEWRYSPVTGSPCDLSGLSFTCSLSSQSGVFHATGSTATLSFE